MTQGRMRDLAFLKVQETKPIQSQSNPNVGLWPELLSGVGCWENRSLWSMRGFVGGFGREGMNRSQSPFLAWYRQIARLSNENRADGPINSNELTIGRRGPGE